MKIASLCSIISLSSLALIKGSPIPAGALDPDSIFAKRCCWPETSERVAPKFVYGGLMHTPSVATTHQYEPPQLMKMEMHNAASPSTGPQPASALPAPISSSKAGPSLEPLISGPI